MPKCLMVLPKHEIADLSQLGLRVRDWAVGIEMTRPAIILSVGFRADGEERKEEFVLSLPAASQLSQGLLSAVEQYLQAVPDDEEDQSDQ